MSNESLTPPPKGLLGRKIVRYPIMLIVLAAGLFVLAREAHHLNINDFIEYWSAARITLAGGNPYSPDELLIMQKEGGLTIQQPTMMYNPPWTIPIIILFGLFSRPLAQMGWILAQIAVLLFCAAQIWQLYGGQPKQLWVAWLVAFTFGPVIIAVIWLGQISPLILTGLVGFLVFMDKPGKGWLAGAFAVLATVKPQVPYIFFIALLLWTLFYKKWSIIIGFMTFFTLLNIIAIVIDPHIYSQFFLCLRNNAPTAWLTPAIGTYLRLLFYPPGFILIYLPPLLGAIWFVYYWIKHHNGWDWKHEMPLLLSVSVMTSAYIWTYDLVVLLIPLLQAFIWLLVNKRRWWVSSVIILYILMDVLHVQLHFTWDDSKFFWFAPGIFLWYLVVRAIHHRSKDLPVVLES